MVTSLNVGALWFKEVENVANPEKVGKEGNGLKIKLLLRFYKMF